MADTTNEAVAEGKVVRIHYRLTVRDQRVDESGDEPLAYLHGGGQLVPGLESRIVGKTPGDKFEAVVPPTEAYGERTAELQKVPKNAFPEDQKIESGMQFAAQTEGGQVVPFWVLEVQGDDVIIDPNHPLAGETLHFDIEVVDVREATEEEKSHGHAHGAGGAHD